MRPGLHETLELVRRVHAGQVDKAGRPYHEHLERVLARLLERWPNAMYYEQSAALLHDILEDIELTAVDLLRMGYDKHTIQIVQTVTKPNDGRPYLEWIQSLADSNFVGALMVKWADNRDNADPGRLALLTSGTRQALAEKYEAARAIIEVPLAQHDIRQAALDEAHRRELQRFYAEPPAVWRMVGDGDVNGGPITESGWYVDPYCDPLCCRPFGPFRTLEDACAWTWTEYDVPEEARVYPTVLPVTTDVTH